MNSQWQQQLLLFNASITNDLRVVFDNSDTLQPGNFIFPISHLAVLKVSGKDAMAFLQGQCTCNVKDINPQTASFGAFCNAKGRVISSFLILLHDSNWLLIMPQVLLPDIQKRLQKYILRADVQLADCSNEYCLTGMQINSIADYPWRLPAAHLAVEREPTQTLRLGETDARYICIANSQETVKLWSELINKDFVPKNTSNWELLDIHAGIPWLVPESSEEHIPQMINMDVLGGISFNKGCYTGQEIVARTHYLGKAKRAMFIAQVHLNQAPDVNTAILDVSSQQVVGSVLTSHYSEDLVTLLIVLVAEARQSGNLYIENQLNTPITVL